MSTKEQRADWRKEFEGRMMASAIWEYCPDEFGELLDDCDRLAQQRAELLDLLTLALPYIEDAEKDPAYKPGHVAKLTRRIRAAVEGNQ